MPSDPAGLAARCAPAQPPTRAFRHRPAFSAAVAAFQQQRSSRARPCGAAPERRAVRVIAAASSSEDQPHASAAAGDSPIAEVERQSERALAYAASAALLGVSGLALAVCPARATEFLWQACPNLVPAGLARVFGSMLLLAAVSLYCLKEAAEKDLLRSDTYKRLNLALMWWGVGTSLSLWLAPQQPLRYALGLCTALLAGTSAHAALTYQETSEPGEGLNPLFLFKQFLRSLGNLSSYSNTASTSILSLYGYGLAAKAAIAASIAIIFHGQLKIAQDGLLLQPVGTLGQSFLPANGVGFALVAVVLFTLKDAAARGRLAASTFKALNVGVSIVGITQLVTLTSWMKAGVLATSKLAMAKLGILGVLTTLALYNYGFAQKKSGH